MDLSRLSFSGRVTRAGLAALAVLVMMEAIAYWGFHESARDRNAFGFDPDTSFVVGADEVLIETAASRRFWRQRYPRSKREYTLRIAAIGDSVFRGASLQESVTYALERDVSATCGVKTEVWNLASPGYGSARKAVVVQKALEFAPDLIVYHAGVTTEYEDARERARFEEFHSGDPRHWADQLPFIGRLKLSKLERVYWEWLPESVRSDGEAARARREALATKFDAQYWAPGMLANLDGTVAQAEQARVPMVIFVHAMLPPATGKLDDLGLDSMLSKRYERRGLVAVVSNRKLFEGTPDVHALFHDSAHWTTPGYELVATELASVVAAALRKEGRCEGPAMRQVVSRPER